MPSCKECNAQFEIHPKDQEILDNFDAPEPALCAPHSLQRRLAFRNERHLYKRVCELCHKDILAMQSPRSYAHVYCRDCWYSDNWDASSYSREYDPNRSFLEQWFELVKQVPQFNLWHQGENVNCGYSNFIFNSKDCYLSFSSVESEGLLYCRNTDHSRECTDCLAVLKSELLYDCVSTNESYASAFLTRAEKCNECYLGRDLTDCQNCFGCVNLRHKDYHWFNEPLSKDEYEKRLLDALKDRATFEAYRRKFAEFSLSLPTEFLTVRNSEEISGDYIYNSRAIRSSYFMVETENCGDCYRIGYQASDLYRMSFGGFSVSKGYEMLASPWTSMSMCSITCAESVSTRYSMYSFGCHDIFGCIGLRKKQYCILNKQYTKDEYNGIMSRIIQSMKESNEWGEFFPVQYSPFGYNDTLADEFFPLEQHEAKRRGFIWEDEQGGVQGKETFTIKEIPDDIRTVEDSISKEILACIRCLKNYRVQKKELDRLKHLLLPIPLECQDCRLKNRMQRYFVPILYHRQCMCTENHSFHPDTPCTNEFETTYRPDRKDRVYCNPCYRECIQ